MDTETVTSISAVIISLIALGATFWQARISRKHNVLSVQPHLISGSNLNQRSDKIEYTLANCGLGPAKITYFAAVIDDEIYDFSFISHDQEVRQMFERIGLDLTGKKWSLKTHDKNSAILPGSEEVILGFYDCLEDEASYQVMKSILPRLGFVVKYKCMYGNEYEISV